MQAENLEAEPLQQESPTVETWIIQDVLLRLGRPDDFHRVQVKPVFGNKYRVIVYVRADATSYRVAHSYFLEADDKGHVLTSSPAIIRTY